MASTAAPGYFEEVNVEKYILQVRGHGQRVNNTVNWTFEYTMCINMYYITIKL